jgi:hypothetical protein
MRLVAGRADYITAGCSYFFYRAIRLIQPMFAGDYKGMIQHLVPVQNDLPPGGKFKQHVYDTIFRINSQYPVMQIWNNFQRPPSDSAGIEKLSGHKQILNEE